MQTDAAPPPIERPPRQIAYKPPELPGDLTPADWQKLLAILEVVKRVAPSDAVPSDVLEVVRKRCWRISGRTRVSKNVVPRIPPN